jgi:hypothetical protein
MSKKITSVMLVFASTLIFFIPLESQAQEVNSATIGISPLKFDPKQPETKAWFVENMEAGQEISREFQVYNYMDKEQDIKININDVTTTSDGGFTYKQNIEVSDQIGKWVSLSEKEIKVAAKSQKTLKFNLKVPAGTKEGEYAGVISVELPPSQDSGAVNVVSRIGARIYLTVGKPSSISTEPSDLTIFDTAITGYNLRPSLDNAAFKLKLKNSSSIFSKTITKLNLESPDGKITKVFEKDLVPSIESFLIMDTGQAWKKGTYKLVVNIDTRPIIAFNKENLTDTSATKELTAEFLVDDTVLDKIKNYQEIKPDLQPAPISSNTKNPDQPPAQTQDLSLTQDENRSQSVLILGGFVVLLVLAITTGFILSRKK